MGGKQYLPEIGDDWQSMQVKILIFSISIDDCASKSSTSLNYMRGHFFAPGSYLRKVGGGEEALVYVLMFHY